jgi:uncharacterized membrane protein YkvA (DUF1232 family)
MSVQVKRTIFYKSLQLVGYADDINIMGRMKRAVSEVYKVLKERAKEAVLNIRAQKNICSGTN